MFPSERTDKSERDYAQLRKDYDALYAYVHKPKPAPVPKKKDSYGGK